jgi:hypothetical protein
MGWEFQFESTREVEARDGIEPSNKGFADPFPFLFGFRAIFHTTRGASNNKSVQEACCYSDPLGTTTAILRDPS